MSRATSGLCALIGIDKPLGITSHDAVARVRRALGERRVGHAGTLDPAASGVLVMGVGQATRLLGQLTLDDKCYEAAIAFGTQTSTDDAEGEVIYTAAVPRELSDPTFALTALAQMVGSYNQIPPTYSAISIDGHRAYERARAGQTVELAARPVTVFSADLIDIIANDSELSQDAVVWQVRLKVSKGTYIRSLARDLGRNLGSAAHLVGLRRTASGSITLDECISLTELEEHKASLLTTRMLDPVRILGYAVRFLDVTELESVSCGRRIEPGLVIDFDTSVPSLRAPHPKERVSLVYKDHFFGIWELRGAYLAACTNFPAGISGVRSASS